MLKRQKVTIGIIIVVIIIIVGGVLYWTMVLRKNDNQNNTNSIIGESGEEIKANLASYEEKDNWVMLALCYLYENPDDVIYFPEGQLRNSWETDYNSQNPLALMGCDYSQEVYGYVNQLLRIDADDDGLNTLLEEIYQTSDESSDTDNDGDPDLSQVINTYPPGSVGALESDYTITENWVFLAPCYLAQYPEDIKYLPEGEIRDDWRISEEEAADDSFQYFCEPFDQEAYDYMQNLMVTDIDEDGLNAFLEGWYRTSDQSSDTDNDGYLDITEIETHNDPNDTLTNSIKETMEQVQEMLVEENPDTEKMTVLCQTLPVHDKVMCFSWVSEHVYDLAYCEQVEFDDYWVSYQIDCECNVVRNIALQTNNPAKCLECARDQEYCLGALASQQNSLEPCQLLSDTEYNTCERLADL